jgi:hypothetical protein
MTLQEKVNITPQEKARELIDKYYWTFGDGYLGEQHIQCALIAVDEVLLFMETDDLESNTHYWANHLEMEYWLQVKQEIEKNYE